MENTIKLICTFCSKEFEKSLREYKRQIKNPNSRFFCSLSCVCSKRNEENPPKGNPKNLKPKSKDEYSAFIWFVNQGDYISNTKKV